MCVVREASTLMEDLKGLVEELEQEQQMSLVNVELVDDELARVYAQSNKAQVSSLILSDLIPSDLIPDYMLSDHYYGCMFALLCLFQFFCY